MKKNKKINKKYSQKLKKNEEKIIKNTYLNPQQPGSFTAVESLRRAVNKINKKPISTTKIKQFLESEHSYTTHKQPKRRYKRRKVVVTGISSQWQADLIDITPLAKFNLQNKFILTVIDVFSKKAFAKPLKSKEAVNVVKAFQSILNEAKTKPFNLQVDKGKEFHNSLFKKLCQQNKIKLFTSEDDQMKAQIVERFNRTIKNRLYRYFASTGDYNWLNVLDKFLNSYNNTFHRSIKMTPNEVKVENEEEVFQTLYPPPDHNSFKNVNPKLKIGDFVRLLNPPKSFKKGYNTQWTEEVFSIRDVVISSQFPLYKVSDLSGEEILGFFYSQELQKIQIPSLFIIEKIIKTEPTRVLVKWEGYSDKFNSYVKKSDLKNFYNKKQ